MVAARAHAASVTRQEKENSMITKPGIYRGMASEDYFADPCPEPSFTQSLAKILLEQSPAHARLEHPRLVTVAEADEEEAEKYVKAQAIGNAAHQMMIGRGKDIALADFDTWRGKDAQAFKAAAIEKGRVWILRKEYEQAIELTQLARTQLDLTGWNDAFAAGDGEVVLCWKEGEGKDAIWLRTMIDWLTPDLRFCYDLKTSGVAMPPHTIGTKIDVDGWDIQAAMHERALAVLDPDGRGRRRFRFVAVENKKPHALLPVELGEHHLAIGRRKLAVAINLWRQAIRSGDWPAYPLRAITPEIPPGRENRWIEREMAMVAAGLWSIDDPIMLGAPVSRTEEIMEPV